MFIAIYHYFNKICSLQSIIISTKYDHCNRSLFQQNMFIAINHYFNKIYLLQSIIISTKYIHCNRSFTLGNLLIIIDQKHTFGKDQNSFKFALSEMFYVVAEVVSFLGITLYFSLKNTSKIVYPRINLFFFYNS